MKRIAIVLMAVAMLVLLPEANASTVHADEPVTYAVKYVSDELGWRYQSNTSKFDDSKDGAPIDILRLKIKDSDLVVIYNNIGTTTSLDLGNVHLSNLTYANDTKWTIVFVGSVQDCYVLGGTAGTINCDVKNAYVYDAYNAVVFNFNGNVEELTIDSGDKVRSSIGTGGTVGHMYAYSSTLSRWYFDFYDFSAGSLYLENGAFKPQGSYKTVEEHAASLITENTTASSDEYDDVPKTGQNNIYLWLLFASIVCFAVSRALKRSAE